MLPTLRSGVRAVTAPTPGLSARAVLRRLRGPAEAEPFAPAVVFVVWLALSISLWLFVKTHGGHVPIFDEYTNAGLVTGATPLTWEALWHQHNEHRIPIPRLLYVGAVRLAGYDLKAPLYLNVVLLSACAGWLVVVLKSIRGHTSFTDAFVPLVLLNSGQVDNLLWGFQIAFIGGTVLTSGLLVVLVRRPANKAYQWIVAALLGMLLPGFGANGVAIAPAVAVWLLANAVVEHRSGSPGRSRAFLPLALGVAMFGVIAFYFYGLKPAEYHPKPDGVLPLLRSSFDFLALSFGPVGQVAGSLTRDGTWSLFGILVAAAVLLTAGIAVYRLAAPELRPVALGSLAGLLGLLALAGGLAYGRAAFGIPILVVNRYVTLALPFAVWMYVTWLTLGPPAGGRVAQVVLFAAACAFLWPNEKLGRERGQVHAAVIRGAEYDIRAGVPKSFVADRYRVTLFPSHPTALQDFFGLLAEHRIGVFRHLQPDPKLAEQPIAASVLNSEGMTWSGTAGTTKRPAGAFELKIAPNPEPIFAVKLTYRLTSPNGAFAHSRLSWTPDDGPGREVANQLAATEQPTSTLVHIDKRVDRIRVELIAPPGTRLELLDVHRLTPADGR